LRGLFVELEEDAWEPEPQPPPSAAPKVENTRLKSGYGENDFPDDLRVRDTCARFRVQCGFCSRVVYDPVDHTDASPGCKVLFCQECAAEAAVRGDHCPECPTVSLTHNTVGPSPLTYSVMGHAVCCTECGWTGRQKEAMDHAVHQCTRRTIVCVCGAVRRLVDMQGHAGCLQRLLEEVDVLRNRVRGARRQLARCSELSMELVQHWNDSRAKNKRRRQSGALNFDDTVSRFKRFRRSNEKPTATGAEDATPSSPLPVLTVLDGSSRLPCSIVPKDDPVIELQLMCTICSRVACEAVNHESFPDCPHTFCRECIEKDIGERGGGRSVSCPCGCNVVFSKRPGTYEDSFLRPHTGACPTDCALCG
ncbi:MAG: hypothetical protein GY851_29230, partial [bacterium]|nr:hypothetical protein [bacterium]